MLTDRQTHTQTDTTENNSTLTARVVTVVYITPQLCTTVAHSTCHTHKAKISSNWTDSLAQGSCGSLKVLEFFSRFSRPEIEKSLKTDIVLESAWIWFSTKPVDTEKGVPDGFFLTSNVHKIHFRRSPGPRWVSLQRLYMLIKVPVCLI